MARELERERERDQERFSRALEQKVQSLVEQGLIRMERSESGSVELNVINEAENAPLPHAGESVCVCVVVVVDFCHFLNFIFLKVFFSFSHR